LCSDPTLWAYVKMYNRISHNAQLKKLIRSKLGTFTHGITVLHLGSYRQTSENGASKPLPRLRLSITPDVMRLLATSCPHLTELGLAYCDLGRSFPQHLPETLTEITLVSCLVPVVLPTPLHQEQQSVRLGQLRRLSIYWAVSATQSLLELLSSASGLRCLELINCPRLRAASIGRICDLFPRLESLALPGIDLLMDEAGDLALSDMVRRLPDLRVLNLSWLGGQAPYNAQAVDRLFRCLMQSATRLRCLACPAGLSEDVLDKMARVPSLRLVCCAAPPAGRPQLASLETLYRRYCRHFYRCGLAMFLGEQPLDCAGPESRPARLSGTAAR
ncbi:hypothetical protein BOX15_Mlig025065g3, partial [Macrostomum lignano]